MCSILNVSSTPSMFTCTLINVTLEFSTPFEEEEEEEEGKKKKKKKKNF